jgi:uncharacterized protein YkwD
MRSFLTALAASGLLVLSATTTALGNEAAAAAAMISSYRASQGLGPVIADSRLNQLAEYQARSVASAGQLSHGNFAGRMAQAGIYAAAENLSMGPASVGAAIARWKASPAHSENLLMSSARRIGLARSGRYWALVLSQ